MHPRSKHWHLINYVLARQRNLKDVLHTRVMPSAKYTDHGLVRCKLKMHFKPRAKNGEPLKKKFKQSMLQSAGVKADFQTNIQSKLRKNSFPEDSSPETLWDKLKTTILQTSKEVLGFATRKNKDWFAKNNVEIQELLEDISPPGLPGSTVLSCEESCFSSNPQ